MMGALNKLQHTTAQISTQHDVHTTEVQSDLNGQAKLAKILKGFFFFFRWRHRGVCVSVAQTSVTAIICKQLLCEPYVPFHTDNETIRR